MTTTNEARLLRELKKANAMLAVLANRMRLAKTALPPDHPVQSPLCYDLGEPTAEAAIARTKGQQ